MWPTVRAAVKQFAQENNLTVHARSNQTAFWFIDPKNIQGKLPSKLKPNILKNPSIYSIVKEIKFHESQQEELTNQLIEYAILYPPDNLVSVEPNNTLSICNLGSELSSYGKIYLIECFEFIGSNIHSKYSLHPFHQHLSNIKQLSLTSTIIPIQMFSVQAAQSLNITSPLIYINIEVCLNTISENLSLWLDHLMPGGIICGNFR